MTNLRKEAAHRQCQVRLKGCMTEPTVLAHLQYPAGVRGMGQKAPDLLGAWCCWQCHEHVDRRNTKIPVEEARMAMYEGTVRTIRALILEGKVTW